VGGAIGINEFTMDRDRAVTATFTSP